ncbi:MAG: hypothetical protein M3Q23_07320 [Actinomycetota bacterium]|nr:hypothetical protein [Actinomycetota bacterium]
MAGTKPGTRWADRIEERLPGPVRIIVSALAFAVVLNMGANFQEHYATSGIAVLVLLAAWLFLSNTLLLVGYKLALRDS